MDDSVPSRFSGLEERHNGQYESTVRIEYRGEKLYRKEKEYNVTCNQQGSPKSKKRGEITKSTGT
jgi:hypothetical protein